MTHIKLGIRSVSPSDQSPRCPHEETLGPYLPIAKFRGVSLRNLVEFLCEMSQTFSTKFRGDNPWQNRKGVQRRNANKELFSWADLYIKNNIGPNILPCGIPLVTVFQSDKLSLIVNDNAVYHMTLHLRV